MSKRTVGRLKTALIVLLAVSALLLAGETGAFRGVLSGSAALTAVRDYLGSGSSRPAENDSGDRQAYTCAAEPFFVVVNAENGGHCAVKYDESALKYVRLQFSVLLGEALGSAAETEKVSRGQWESALQGPGVFFDYLSAQPLSLLALWQGIEMTGGAAQDSARRLCLAAEGDSLALYYIREADGSFRKCATALYTSAVSDKLAEYPPRSDRFAFELGDAYARLDPWSILLASLPQVRTLSCSSPLAEGLAAETVIETLGMNTFFATGYTETDGSVVYVEGSRTLRIGADGVVEFQEDLSGEAGEYTAVSQAEAVELALELVKDGPGSVSGDAAPSLISVDADSDTGVCTVTFGYSVAGVPVSTPINGAATVQLLGNRVVYASLYYRSYTLTEETPLLLPELQAAAIVSASGGSEALLVYTESGAVALPGWENG